jgi:opacity protein-like surface antigen
MRHTAAAALLAAILTVAAAAPAVAAANPSGTGLPSQSCQGIVADGGTTPGHASTSPGSPFNEPGPNNPGGIGGQHYNETSQYDVACFQVSPH